jgi:glutathione S-transferase
MSASLPVLYSFRRCPYAMRARMALYYSGINCELREVNLRDKPDSLFEISPKGTVPVLQLKDGTVIDESLDIIKYSISQNDPEKIGELDKEMQSRVDNIISANDIEFVGLLRKYKYFENYQEQTQVAYRNQIETIFLEKYEDILKGNKFLIGKKSIADIAVLPFIRQFAFVERDWFFSSKYKNMINWLNAAIENDIFENVILAKHDMWSKGDSPVYFI